MEPTSVAVLLLSIAMAVALVARRLRIPYTVALVATGLAIGQTRWVKLPVLSKGFVYGLVLPGLLFEAAYHLPFAEFLKRKVSITTLALPGVIVGTLITGGLVAHLGLPDGHALGLRQAMIFAAIVAATDPVAVVALFREVGTPSGLSVLVEGESLLNDGTAAVLFSILLGFTSGGTPSLAHSALEFFRVAGVGVATGLVFALGALLVMKRLNDPLIEATLTTIVAYGSFAVGEHFGGSGVLSTVTGGMLCGSYAREVAMSERTRAAVSELWHYLAFVLNSAIFLIMGASVDLSALLGSFRHIAIAYASVLAARVLVVGIVRLVLARTRERISLKWSIVVTWSGLRGALSMVLALSLPLGLHERSLIITMTFGVVLLSLFVQGLTLAPLLSRLKLMK